jgi:hypothetical protein
MQGRSTHVVVYWGGRDQKAEVPRGGEQVWRNYGDCLRRVMLLVSPLTFVDAREWGKMCIVQATGRRRQVPVDLCKISDAGGVVDIRHEDRVEHAGAVYICSCRHRISRTAVERTSWKASTFSSTNFFSDLYSVRNCCDT